MDYQITKWKIKDLLDLYEERRIRLNPPYQRNEIWSTRAQKLLIDSLKRNYPLPNFFIHERDGGEYDMVDGQQRTRAIIGYCKGDFKDIDGDKFDDDTSILEYEIPIVLISSNEDIEDLREFYVRVNKTGLKLNRPELYKAEYYNTKFLNLVDELSQYSKFRDLELFTERSSNRMKDREYIEELVAQIEFGITDKKYSVDKLYKQDVNEKQIESIKTEFIEVINLIHELCNYKHISDTRYKQRNDFYTFFGLIKDLKNSSFDVLLELYKVLVKIGPDIKPSNEDCEPLQEYAFHCVSQSNSKNAREERKKILGEILLNQSKIPNHTQEEIMTYYKFDSKELKKIGSFYTIDIEKIL